MCCGHSVKVIVDSNISCSIWECGKRVADSSVKIMPGCGSLGNCFSCKDEGVFPSCPRCCWATILVVKTMMCIDIKCFGKLLGVFLLLDLCLSRFILLYVVLS